MIAGFDNSGTDVTPTVPSAATPGSGGGGGCMGSPECNKLAPINEGGSPPPPNPPDVGVCVVGVDSPCNGVVPIGVTGVTPPANTGGPDNGSGIPGFGNGSGVNTTPPPSSSPSTLPTWVLPAAIIAAVYFIFIK